MNTSTQQNLLNNIESFLPNCAPLIKLNNNDMWEIFVSNIRIYNNNQTTRENIYHLPDFILPSTKSEYQRAYVIFCMVSHSYVWCSGKETAVYVLPAKIAVPFYKISLYLGIFPVLTHAAVDLWNWKLIDATKECVVENMDIISSITGTESEKYFYLVMTEIEWRGGKIIKALLQLPELIKKQNNSEIYSVLKRFLDTLSEIEKTLAKMYKGCLPEVFYNQLRPYLNGWSATTNNGVIFEGVVAENYPTEICQSIEYNGSKATLFKCGGGSAAQSSLIQLYDIALNVNHSSDLTSKFLNNMLQYMPLEHSEFLLAYKQKMDEFPLDAYIRKCDSSDKICDMYDSCVKRLVNFRKAHKNLAHKYITRMANTQDTLIGTGGTDLDNFLNTCISETKKKLIN